jgi:lysophospholipase L1-like esterase
MQPQDYIMKRIIVLGDNVAYGGWDSEGGWVDRIREHVHTATLKTGGKSRYQVMNLSISGDTTADIIKRMRPEVTARLSPGWSPVIIIAAGTNDTRSLDKPGNVEVNFEQYIRNMSEIIDFARSVTPKVLLVGLTPLASDSLQFKNYFYEQKDVSGYDLGLVDLAKEASVPYVELFEFMEPWIGKLYCWDGLHPNDAGHKMIFDHVKPALVKLIKEA